MNASQPQSLSETLRGLTADETVQRLSLAEVMHRLDDQARGVLIILFSIPNCLPGIPGTSAVTGLPLLILCLQMALQRPPWLPGFLSRRSVSRQGLAEVLGRARPWIERIERLIHPRLTVLASGPAERLVGILGVVLSLTVMLPIPFGNMMPAIALICLSFGLVGRDGVWILAGLFMSGMAAAVLALAGWAAVQSFIYVALNWFGIG